MQTISGGVMNKKTKKLKAEDLSDFTSWQNEYYKKHPEEISLLSKEAIDSFNNTPDMPLEVLLASLRRIAELYGLSKLARETKLNRESLYKSLSPRGNPTVRTLSKVSAAMGYRLTITPVNRV